ncbi:DUF3298 domain-containing protein [Pseudomonas berkeleyensis]|uniref:DUF3298 domain-containing protein n=1 Tax=Pseudomonas berkeleyensis TaxID=2726956 RepID=A0A7G5DNF3_9PSED|nr:DUF3298 domain-containing protein [Pseudomonas berkeleyensis]QMV63278.1 DUF3298 domain-containing protein [Pseudomonas berkeleyensis]WSO38735.1 DUF3298 domain-containing protein [Pseudomonas berkeleyensis]
MRFLFLFLLSAALPVAAELRFENLEAKRSDWETYRFPLLQGDSLAVRRINTYLHAMELEGLPGRFERSPFERIWPKEGEIWGTNSLDYQIDTEQPGFLSLTISGEYTGAYTSMGHVTYLFDLASGHPIGLSQLFTSAGLQRLGERIGRERNKRIEDYLAGIPVPGGNTDELVSLSPDDHDERSDEQRDMYRQCLPSRSKADLSYDRLQLGKQQLTLTAGGCAPHVTRALDDLGDFVNSVPYAELDTDLSPYGRCLLLEQRSDCHHPGDLKAGGVYWGKIGGRYPITLVVGTSQNSRPQSSSYFYDKYATRIELSGNELRDGHLHLRESGDTPATFDLQLQADGSLRGTWQQDGGQALSVELH